MFDEVSEAVVLCVWRQGVAAVKTVRRKGHFIEESETIIRPSKWHHAIIFSIKISSFTFSGSTEVISL